MATQFNSVEQALRDTAALYRKNLWTDAGSYAEIWQKDALAGVVYPVTSMYDVPRRRGDRVKRRGCIAELDYAANDAGMSKRAPASGSRPGGHGRP